METPPDSRSRLRFDRLDRATAPDGSGRVSVTLKRDGHTFEGTVPCLQTQQGLITAASQAALRATLASRAGESLPLNLEVGGVKAVKAFDGWVVVARLHGSRGDEKVRLLGAAPCEGEDDLLGAAVRAVLNASNRALEQSIAR